MTYSATVLADSPLAYWRLGDASGTTMTDSSGNARNGSYVGSPTLGVPGLLTGDTDTAITLNGTSQYCDTAYAAWMNVAAITVEAFIKTTDTDLRMVAREGTTYAWSIQIVSGTLYWLANSAIITSVAVAANDGNVHQIAASYDGTTVSLYMDGLLKNSAAWAGPLPQPTNTGISIGASETNFGYMAGTIDEVSVYGSALSASRIAAHYSAATGGGGGGGTPGQFHYPPALRRTGVARSATY